MSVQLDHPVSLVSLKDFRSPGILYILVIPDIIVIACSISIGILDSLSIPDIICILDILDIPDIIGIYDILNISSILGITNITTFDLLI